MDNKKYLIKLPDGSVVIYDAKDIAEWKTNSVTPQEYAAKLHWGQFRL